LKGFGAKLLGSSFFVGSYDEYLENSPIKVININCEPLFRPVSSTEKENFQLKVSGMVRSSHSHPKTNNKFLLC
jgi:hypothetical protein